MANMCLLKPDWRVQGQNYILDPSNCIIKENKTIKLIESGFGYYVRLANPLASLKANINIIFVKQQLLLLIVPQ